MYPEDPPEPTTEEFYEGQVAQAVACIRELEVGLEKADAERDDARRQAATYAAHIEDLSEQIDELRADLDRYKRDWLALLCEIAKLYDAVQDLDESEAWQHAGDGTIWEEFDPWQALTVAVATVKAGRDGAGPIANKTAPRIFKLQAECDLWRERALVARRKYHEQKRITERVRNRLQQIRDKLGLRW